MSSAPFQSSSLNSRRAAAVLLGGQHLEVRAVHARVCANVVVAVQFLVRQQIRDGRRGLPSRTVGEVAAVGIGVDCQDPVAADLAHRRAERHRHGGLADAALEAEDADLVGVARVAADPRVQIHLVQLVGRQPEVDPGQQVDACGASRAATAS